MNTGKRTSTLKLAKQNAEKKDFNNDKPQRENFLQKESRENLSEKTKTEFKTNFDQMINIRRGFGKIMSEKLGQDAAPAFCMFAEALSEKDFSSQQKLSNYLDCNKAHTSRMLTKMQSKQLVEVSDKNIHLTEKGKEFAKKANAAKDEVLKCLFENVTNEELNNFVLVIHKVIENQKKLLEN